MYLMCPPVTIGHARVLLDHDQSAEAQLSFLNLNTLLLAISNLAAGSLVWRQLYPVAFWHDGERVTMSNQRERTK